MRSAGRLIPSVCAKTFQSGIVLLKSFQAVRELAIASITGTLALCLFLKYPFAASAPSRQSLTVGPQALSAAEVDEMGGALDVRWSVFARHEVKRVIAVR